MTVLSGAKNGKLPGEMKVISIYPVQTRRQFSDSRFAGTDHQQQINFNF
jgi:hypothetical protein